MQYDEETVQGLAIGSGCAVVCVKPVCVSHSLYQHTFSQHTDQNNVQQYQNTFWLLQGYKGNENSVAYIQTAVAEEPNLLHEDPSFAVKEGEQVLVLAKERQIPSFIGCALSAVLWRKLSWDEKVFMWVYEHRWAIGVGIVLLMVVTVKRWRERRLRA